MIDGMCHGIEFLTNNMASAGLIENGDGSIMCDT